MMRCLPEVSSVGIQNLPNKLPSTSHSKFPTLSTRIATKEEESAVPIEVPQPDCQRTYIVLTSDIIIKGIEWVVGFMEDIHMWQGCWCGEKSLKEACTGLHENIDKLGMYITIEKVWDVVLNGCGTMKMNTDDSAQGSSSQAGFRGVNREE
ncbi:hypothetical protein RHSIM_Rhsim03G0102100 [Rhododendron simsii]|uniref:Uncharacterized protein n=1 Tax=Rhododendron simsii TaxID=118357 RepID=A0A834HK21_RHOSS|nr:hypothetical protein RHSIM_Rhsim03G0102100 [Rhododendron simsii]